MAKLMATILHVSGLTFRSLQITYFEEDPKLFLVVGRHFLFYYCRLLSYLLLITLLWTQNIILLMTYMAENFIPDYRILVAIFLTFECLKDRNFLYFLYYYWAYSYVTVRRYKISPRHVPAEVKIVFLLLVEPDLTHHSNL
jgi:hypothetical protein